jgi:LmbE family N-acetylglucosaminyl deacetylase
LVPQFSFARQRVLIIAPHPDDESLATGGLIQRAIKEGAEVHVVLISNGDNNPWPQRFLERRWRIGQQERKRWGARRWQEALSALRILGVPKSHTSFLGIPDQGTTPALMHAQAGPLADLVKLLKTWRPTLVVSPSPHDVHPDHSAFAVLMNLALRHLPATLAPRQIHYLVHTRKQGLPTPRWTLRLTAAEQATKRDAILQHHTQMALSRKRFVGYARPVEHFYPPEATDPTHPLRHVGFENGAFVVRIQPAGVAARQGELLVAFENPLQGSVRWRVPVPSRAGIVRIHDAITGRILRNATLRRAGRMLEVRLPVSPMLPVQRVALKFHRRIAFYDEAGWCEFTMPAIDPHLCSVTPSSVTPSSSSLFAFSSFGGGSEASA